MIKIAQILTVLNGGAGISAFRLHESLRKQPDFDSCIVQRFYIENQEFAEKHNIITAPIARSPFIRLRKKYNLHVEHFNGEHLNKCPRNYEVATFPWSSYRLEELPEVKNADIIHLHWVSDFINFPSFFKNIKQPIVWTLHDMNPFQGMFHYEEDLEQNREAFGDIDRKILSEKIRSVHKNNKIHIVTPSQWMKKKSVHSAVLGRYPHYVIPPGLDLSLYSELDKPESKKILGLENDFPILMTIAQDINLKRKGADLFYNAVESLDINVNVVTVGGAKKEITNSKVNHIHFDFISDVTKLNQIYSAADITIISSREDNLPNTMLESFMNGTPVMSFSNGGMAEHVTTGTTGILIEEISSNALIKNIIDFLDNKYTFDRKAIRQYAVENFPDHKQVYSYAELYKNISEM